jgi:K(+)-stimulated pyrophosphate-energized sodium pump
MEIFENFIIGPMTPWGPFVVGLVGLVCAFVLYGLIMKYPEGNAKVAKIGDQIHLGARVFMITEYKILLPVLVVLVLACGFSPLGWNTALAIAVGALSSAIAGFIGMYSATKANVRTATAAEESGQERALSISFFGGSIMGLCVASMGLIGLGGLYVYFVSTLNDDFKTIASALEGFGVGASAVALFSRVGGGIYTKSADVGADLVGKIEAGIPEDDPRNPGVIADNVGDNVGDIAGMGSDIFESYCGAMIASIAIAATLSNPDLMFLPLWLSASGLFCSLIGIGIVRSQVSRSPAVALRYGTFFSPIIFLIFAGLSVYYSPNIEMNYFYSILTGAVGGILIGLITEYYTGGTTNDSPVGKIAKSGEIGPATVIISGLSVGMVSVVMPILVIAGIIGVSTYFSGLYGVGIAAVGMLSTVGITMAIDAYGPVADNAGGIAEMSGMKSEVREITDSLDELGNTTAAIGKGFAIGAAALAALAIIAAFTQVTKVELLLSDPRVLVGMFIGGTIPFLVSSITMTAVGDAAFEMIEEIRRQFREIPGLLEGKADPDTAKCVDIATNAALKKMLLPGAIAILSPIVIGFGLGAIELGGMLAGALLGCVLLALMMANAGGAWDNAKKFVEKGNFGGKGTETHSAAVVGDTVGDPFKDTSGPAMNILINVMAIVSLVIAPLL